MFKQSPERQKGRSLWGGFHFTSKSTTANSKRIISISHWQDPQLWQRSSARWRHCDIPQQCGSWESTELVSSPAFVTWSFPPNAMALEISISLFLETEAGTWHLVRKYLLYKWLKKQETSVLSWVLKTFYKKEPSQQCESILNWMVCTCTTPCAAVCQPGQF